MSNLQYQVAPFDASGTELTDFPRISAFFHEVGGKLENRDAIGWATNPDRPLRDVASVKVLNVFVSTDGLHSETVFEKPIGATYGPHSSPWLAAGEVAQP